MFRQHPRILEFYVARSLWYIDEELRRQKAQEAPPLPAEAVEGLKVLQRHVQDIALLACSRGISQQTITMERGIPPELRIRLEAAFGHLPDALRSRLGNSKFFVFMQQEEQGLRRRHRRGRKNRRSQRAADEAEETLGEPGMVHAREAGARDSAESEPMYIHAEDQDRTVEHLAWSPSWSPPSVSIHISL